MKNKIIALIIFSSLYARSEDSWFCTEGSSRRIGTTVEACGIGTDPDEQTARQKALEAARTEFNQLCASSADCNPQAVTADPKRTTCGVRNGITTCHRMIAFTLTGSITHAETGSGGPARIHRGMSKQELLDSFGTPNQVIDSGNGYFIFTYDAKSFCTAAVGHCAVVLSQDRVDHWSDFELSHTDALETKSLWQKITAGLGF